jgi:phage tail sheath protein FI
MSLNVGINVVEVDGRATPAIAAAPTSVAAFVGRTERGPVDRPVRLTSLAQFRERFGANLADGLLGYAVEGFFANGGTTAYVVRAAGGGTPASTTLKDRTTPTAVDILTVSAGSRGLPDPGEWGERLTVDVADDPGRAAGAFRLTVRLRSGAGPDQVETWDNLRVDRDSPDHAVTRLNDPFTGSRLVVLEAAADGGVGVPAVVSNTPLTAGADPVPVAADLIGSAGDRRGLHALDTTPAQLLAIPDLHGLDPDGGTQVITDALDYCAARGDLMFVGSAPDRQRRTGVTVPRAVTDYDDTAQSVSAYLAATQAFSSTLQAAKRYGALYAPWIRVVDPVGVGPAPARFVPPDGHVMGVYARTDAERGIAKAPAGVAAQVRGALDVAARFTDGEHTDLVRTGLVNGIRPTPGAGIVVVASRTLSTDTRWWFVNVRLLFNFVKVSLRDGLRFARQEPHTEALRRTVRFNVVTPFLLGLWRQGAFGSDPPDQTFTVKCDAENNPPSEVDQGNFRLEVYFYPVRPAETVVLVVGQQPGGGTAGES